MGGNNEFFENFERNKYLKKLPSMQRVKQSPNCSPLCLLFTDFTVNAQFFSSQYSVIISLPRTF